MSYGTTPREKFEILVAVGLQYMGANSGGYLTYSGEYFKDGELIDKFTIITNEDHNDLYWYEGKSLISGYTYNFIDALDAYRRWSNNYWPNRFPYVCTHNTPCYCESKGITHDNL